MGIHTLRLAPELTDAEVAKAQRDDPALAPIIAWLEQDITPTTNDIRTLPLSSRNLWLQRVSLALRADVLIRRGDVGDQLVVPYGLQRCLFNLTHAGPLAAHLGPQRTLQQLKAHYYWPGMRKDVAAWYSQCDSCAKAKPPPSRYHAPLTKVLAGAPMDIVVIDILSGLPATAEGYRYILVATDYLTKWVEAYPLRDQEASTCMRELYNGFFARFGLPRQLHADQGRNFES